MAEETERSIRPIVLTVIVVVALIAAGALAMRSLKGPSLRTLPTHAYFYDANNGQLFETNVDASPPVPSPSGGNGFRAYVFSCGECTEQDRFVGYIETSSPNTATGGRARAAGGQGSIAAPSATPKWVGRTSREGQTLIAQAMTKCGADKRAVACEPKSK